MGLLAEVGVHREALQREGFSVRELRRVAQSCAELRRIAQNCANRAPASASGGRGGRGARRRGARRRRRRAQVLHLLAAREEDDRLRLQVRAQEAHRVSSFRGSVVVSTWCSTALRRRRRAVLVHREQLRRAEREPRERRYRARLRRREEPRDARSRQGREDRRQRRLEAQIEDAVGLVEDEQLQVGRLEADRLVEVLQQPARRRDEDVHPADALRLLVAVLAADDEPRRQVVLHAEGAEHVEDLEGELARRRDDERAEPVRLRPPLAEEQLEQRHEERERLPRPVFAAPRMSRPASACGIAARCTSVIVVHLPFASPASVRRESGSCANLRAFVYCSRGAEEVSASAAPPPRSSSRGLAPAAAPPPQFER